MGCFEISVPGQNYQFLKLKDLILPIGKERIRLGVGLNPMVQAHIRSARLLFRCCAYLFDGSVGLFTDGLSLSRPRARIAHSLRLPG